MNALLRARAAVETPRDESGRGVNRAFLWRPETDHVRDQEGDLAYIGSVIPKVFVVDADASVRESLQTLIRKSGWAVETFASASQLLARERPTGPTCLILDADLPDGNALDVQERVARDGWVMPIVFTSAHGDVPMAVRAIKAGAIEVLLKPLVSEVLLGAINEALERSRAALVEESDLRALEARYASLSSREQQVLGLVVRGFLNKQVGGALGISEITVKGHRGSMMRKMQANSLADLVIMAARLRLPRAGSELNARPIDFT